MMRSRIISLIRRFMEERDFLEVETPMMQPQGRRRRRPPVQDPPQRPRTWTSFCGSPRSSTSSASITGGHRAGLRDQPEFPERGDLHLPQPRIHDDGVLSGLCDLRRPDDD
ncbi:MAG: hypothetical protein MZV70_48670 [Desulfobacterales bacterium]|nr:hypothetical protein [Desulfobacterales bacterium]